MILSSNPNPGGAVAEPQNLEEISDLEEKCLFIKSVGKLTRVVSSIF